MELDRDNDRQTAGNAAPARRSLFRRDELARRNDNAEAAYAKTIAVATS